MNPTPIKIRGKYRYKAPGAHKSTHNQSRTGAVKRADFAGMQGAKRTKHSYWTVSTQWGNVLNNGKVPAAVPQAARLLAL